METLKSTLIRFQPSMRQIFFLFLKLKSKETDTSFLDIIKNAFSDLHKFVFK